MGIPIRGNLGFIEHLIELALSFDFVEMVHIGVNPTSINLDLHRRFSRNKRVKFSFHTTDIGLYGNFRFLARNCTSAKFMWWCFDDRISSDLQSLFDFAESSSRGLTLGKFDLQEFDPSSLEYFGKRIEGSLPRTETEFHRLTSALNCDPSWIFGVWDAEYLREIFPKNDFDWLDSYLLFETLIRDEVQIAPDVSPSTIGTLRHLGKVPHSVSPGGHEAAGIIFRLLRRIPSYVKSGRLFMSYLRELINLAMSARHYRKIKRGAAHEM